MSGMLIGAALIAALAAVAVRATRAARARRDRERTLAATPGLSAERPLAITSFHELDDAVDTLRCPCGGPLERIGEAGRTGPRGPVRVVRCACTICEQDVDLFFDLAAIRN